MIAVYPHKEKLCDNKGLLILRDNGITISNSWKLPRKKKKILPVRKHLEEQLQFCFTHHLKDAAKSHA